jgi:hypothetical protein
VPEYQLIAMKRVRLFYNSMLANADQLSLVPERSKAVPGWGTKMFYQSAVYLERRN